MVEQRFDAIVVGAGPSGNAAAYTLAKEGLNVLQLERGEYAGSKNVQGAILYSDALEKLIPSFREDAPLERHVIEQRLWMLDDASYTGMHYRSEEFNEEKPNRYTIIRAQFDKWFSQKVRDAGATVLYETTVKELIRNTSGKVIGVQTDREDGAVMADVVILAEGVNGLVGQRSGLRDELKPDTVALAVKEMHFLPRDVIESRFNLKGDEGVVIEAMGSVTLGMTGTAFLYTNEESISVGIGCLVSDFKETGAKPYELLERFKSHPAIAPLLAGSEVKEYAAHLIPEGGYNAIPSLFGDGWLMVGDAGHFVNAVHREGSNLAMTTGRVAAETVVRLHRMRKEMTKANLAEYQERLEKTFVLKDMRKYRKIPAFLHGNKETLFGLYPRLLSKAAQTWFRVDGLDKKAKEKAIVSSFRQARTLRGMIGDAFKLARAWR
ncbi:FAD-dependent monooxygenase [Afifella marina]|uniref:Protein FixC n=1 Tax=Afifella marina DSM 2698 TaxID=1120955 RepID=A0A1G5N4X8_AFIMA|nr:FAD-dependent monooxygenase [Afifella marina]MBK1622494.1 FAD-dependent oxidoreductase [Afifella marina DSM 2698]MBK1626791.1 FAD-dependent oxidoreductase [Afifella marina]MBK5919279.1 FAD-dependent oxidoreductase [Afifella marina]RAI21317.1 FAD-dependent oxidoreductase [Afifella marina DSM 2698]SCZ32485.1 electron transfer flavoprotein-quinone oxidoreductase [Afifella marina DSM 2698]